MTPRFFHLHACFIGHLYFSGFYFRDYPEADFWRFILNIKSIITTGISAGFLLSANALWAGPMDEVKEKIAKCNEKQCNQLRLSGINGLTEIPKEILDIPTLNALDLSRLKIADLSPLSGLHALRILNISDTKVSDFSPLSALRMIAVVEARNTDVADISALAGLMIMQNLLLDNTKVADIVDDKRYGKNLRCFCKRYRSDGYFCVGWQKEIKQN
ncbi:MAG TPA: hypothetical protein DD729_03980 [Rhodobacteraceae bacterium]|nr:hypothetical protein [Paracoccaceae bacterium]